MQYSRLAFTHPQDRPVAIAGLEKRLINSADFKGRFGIFNGNTPGQLRRSLLWHRASKVPSLEMINFRGARGWAAGATAPPTWSWMAYMGEIQYLDPPFSSVEWERDDILPVESWGNSDGSAGDVGLSVLAREFEPGAATAGPDPKIILDIPPKTDGPRPPLQCVVLGRQKPSQQQAQEPVSSRTYFVLLVTPRASPVARNGQVYHREGVGSVPGSWIKLDDSAVMGNML